MVTVSNPIWKEVKIALTKPVVTGKSAGDELNSKVSNLKQRDMLSVFSKYVRRDVFVKVVAK